MRFGSEDVRITERRSALEQTRISQQHATYHHDDDDEEDEDFVVMSGSLTSMCKSFLLQVQQAGRGPGLSGSFHAGLPSTMCFGASGA